jgi:hypothetical protein
MNFTELQDRLKFILNFNDTQTDQDFTNARIKQALNFSYESEINRAQAEGSRRYFRAVREIEWVADELTYTLAYPLDQRGLIRITDITNTDPGYALVFDENGFHGDVFWKDRNTIQWGTQGPNAGKTLRVEFYTRPIAMVEDNDEPELIPPQFRELLLWSAACWLRDIADDDMGTPQSWQRRLDEWRIDFWKYLSRGRPTDDVPAVTNTYPDDGVGLVY